jgi:16S rRNA (guanine527-N7)-methyltransferase
MPPDAASLRPALEAGLSALGLALPPQAVDQLLAYQALLARWNAVYNLTAVRDPAQMLSQHLLDSLAVVGPLQRQKPQPGRLLDVGSGGGLPGVVLAIALPAWRVTCVDAVAKKSRFVQQVAVELGLPNLSARHGRVESASAEGGFDIVASRAFASLADFVALTLGRLAEGGCWMAMKGRRPDNEVAALPPDVGTTVEPIVVPGLDAERCVVWIKRLQP